MKNSFTFNDLFRFAYGEQDEDEKGEMGIACHSDRHRMKAGSHRDGLKISPDKRIINNILNYSRALTILNTKSTGNFILMLN